MPLNSLHIAPHYMLIVLNESINFTLTFFDVLIFCESNYNCIYKQNNFHCIPLFIIIKLLIDIMLYEKTLEKI